MPWCVSLVLLFASACGAPQPAGDGPPTEGVQGAWEFVVEERTGCTVFCPGDQMMVFQAKCADASPDVESGDRVVYVVDGNDLSLRKGADIGYGTVAFSDSNHMVFRDANGTAIQLVRTGVPLDMCHPHWGLEGDGHLDSDGDGIPNSSDLCEDEPEDMDGFRDDDGCIDQDH
jgi:hypothetical protein